jgi:aspartyl protease family protein
MYAPAVVILWAIFGPLILGTKPVTVPIVPQATGLGAPAATSSRVAELLAGENGHFEVNAWVDGQTMIFLVDTGASHIVLRASDAVRLGLHPMPRDYSIKVATANGEGRAALVHLRTIAVGSIMVYDLPAFVTPDEALAVDLLRMSFLSRVRWSQNRGRLILEQ